MSSFSGASLFTAGVSTRGEGWIFFTMVEKCNQLVECDNDAELRRFAADRMIKFQDFATKILRLHRLGGALESLHVSCHPQK
jgi:hypothetical protein